MIFLVCIILSLLSFIVTDRFIRYAEANNVLIDYPNNRSSHSKPVVRGAGIVFVGFSLLCWIISSYLIGSFQLAALCVGALPLAAIGFLDDLKSVPISVRLVVHIFSASVFLLTVPAPGFLEFYFGKLAYAWYPFALFFMVAVINLYNFMDGIDGLVSLQGVTVLGVWCVVSFMSGGYSTEYMVCAVAAATIFGFLLHNWKPATVFMGDVGSTFIGYTISCLAVVQAPGVMRSDNFFVLVILMLPILFDATFTILVRMAKGEAWYRPHKRHLFQRLIASGYSHITVSIAYGGMTVILGLLLLSVRYGFLTDIRIAAVLLVLPFVMLYLWVRITEGHYGRHVMATSNA